VSEHQVRTREHAETAEVMLADPGGIQPNLFGVDRLVEDIGDDLIGAAPIILIVVVAQCEITEFHYWVPLSVNSRRDFETRTVVSIFQASASNCRRGELRLEPHVGLFSAMR
jgi:hypothetical protein